MEPQPRVTPLFRWSGAYWGFILGTRIYDRHGHQVGWVEPGLGPGPGADVFLLSGQFMGELRDEHYVVRMITRAEPVPRASRPPAPLAEVPDAPPDRAPRVPSADCTDALPWPLRPPDRPRL